MINVKDNISPIFYDVFDKISSNQFKFSDLWLSGGRGSLKSSFMGIIIPYLIMRDGSWVDQGLMSSDNLSNAVVLRKFGNTLRDSVFSQIEWGINKLNSGELWECALAPLCWTYLPTGQKIYFRGLDDATKTKSMKPKVGRILYAWYEELEEYNGIEEIRKANQSFFRGGDSDSSLIKLKPISFESYNPPLTMASWVNKERENQNDSRFVIHSTYLDIPEPKRTEWLGEAFIDAAESLKQRDFRAYRHEYLGEVVGTSGAIFKNLCDERISDQQIKFFHNCLCGIDWGFGHPFVWLKCSFDKENDIIYVYDEVVETELINKEAMRIILKKNHNDKRIGIIADSAEKKSIYEWRGKGWNIRGCRKPKNSDRYGIKWISGRKKLVVDSVRCPKAYQQLSAYEYVRDKNGDYLDQLPKINDDVPDCLRYALEPFIYPMTFSANK